MKHLLPILMAALTTTLANAEEKRPPNFVLIFADDLGYGDLACFGCPHHRSPNLDRMAEQGMKLTSFYSTCGVCTPSRSSLMTGCYPRRVNMHTSARNEWVLFPVARRGLNPKEITVAEVLKEKGYATQCIGKWHLGDQPPFLPTKQGFDGYFGIPYSNDMGSRQRKINPPLPLLRDDKVIEAPVDQNTLTMRYTEEAVKFITDNKDKPFFLYLPHTMPHNPVHSSERFRGKSKNKGYGDCVEEIDWSTGEILKTLAKHGLDKNTLVIFTSDNGAAKRWGGRNLPLSGFKGSTSEGGMRVPCIAWWPSRIPSGATCDKVVSTIDVLPTFAKLAGASAPKDRILDGRDVSSLLSGNAKAESPHEAFFYYFRDQLQAVRSGKWKLYLRYLPPRGKTPTGLRLYDLEADVAEETNVADKHPDVVKRLTAHADKARKDLGDRNVPGANQRAAGQVAEAKPLTLE